MTKQEERDFILRRSMMRELWDQEEFYLFNDAIRLARMGFFAQLDKLTTEQLTRLYERDIKRS